MVCDLQQRNILSIHCQDTWLDDVELFRIDVQVDCRTIHDQRCSRKCCGANGRDDIACVVVTQLRCSNTVNLQTRMGL